MDLIGLYKENELNFTEYLLTQPSAAVISTENDGAFIFNGAVPRGRVLLDSGSTKNGKAEIDFPHLGAAVSGNVSDINWRDVQWKFKGVRPVNTARQNISFGIGIRNEDGSVYACFRQSSKTNYINFSVFREVSMEETPTATNILTGIKNGVYVNEAFMRNFDNYTDFSIRLRGTTVYYGTFGGELGSILTSNTNGIKLYPFLIVATPYTNYSNSISIDEIAVRCRMY